MDTADIGRIAYVLSRICETLERLTVAVELLNATPGGRSTEIVMVDAAVGNDMSSEIVLLPLDPNQQSLSPPCRVSNECKEIHDPEITARVVMRTISESDSEMDRLSDSEVQREDRGNASTLTSWGSTEVTRSSENATTSSEILLGDRPCGGMGPRNPDNPWR